eukprot:Selendium_serpulae@DN3809_c0_g1_i1.p1
MPPRRAGAASKQAEEPVDADMLAARNKLKEKFGGGDANRVGGKGTARRKKVGGHKSATSDDRKVAGILKRMNMTSIPGIEEVMIYKEDKQVLIFSNPKVQAQPQANTYLVMGQSETKPVDEVLSKVMQQPNLPRFTPEIIQALSEVVNKGGENLDMSALAQSMSETRAAIPDKALPAESSSSAKPAETKPEGKAAPKKTAKAASDSSDVSDTSDSSDDSDDVRTFETTDK